MTTLPRHAARSRSIHNDEGRLDFAILRRLTEDTIVQKQAFVYILANQRNGTIYTGVTSDLVKRIYEHKTKMHSESFTSKYSVNKLVWYVTGDDISSAIALEKKIKNRNRSWKIALIEKNNPMWNDLSADILDSATEPE